MLITDIIARIEELAPPWAQAAWDKSGLQLAAERRETAKIAVCLDALPESVDKAVAWGAGLILSHHPLSLKPELPNRRDAYWKVLKRLFAADVCLYAAHTSLDVNIAGPSGWLGRALGLENIHVLEECSRQDEKYPEGLGFGGVGSLPRPLPAEECLERIVGLMGGHGALCGPELPPEIRRVAFCGGSGSSLGEAAKAAGADILVTGDVKYHVALDAPLPILDIGHFSYENEMMRQMADLLGKNIGNVETLFVNESEPFRIIGSNAGKLADARHGKVHVLETGNE